MTQHNFRISYGGLTTNFKQSATHQNVWQWVTTDDRTAQRIDGSEADSTSVLYMLWNHLKDGDCQISAQEY